MPEAAPLPHVRRRAFKRAQRLRQLGYASYADYLRSAHWLRIRTHYFESDLPQACMCGEAEDVQLHHTTYDRIGAEELTDLTPLCGNCHSMVHVLERRGDIALNLDGLYSPERAAQTAPEREARTAALREAGAMAQYEERMRTKARELRQRLLRCIKQSIVKDIDIRDELDALERALEALEQKSL